MGLYDYTIYDFICRNAQLYPERDAVIFNQTRINFKDYKLKCDHLAAGLLKEGIEIGDRIAVVANNCDDYVILYGAAAKIGAIILPVNWRFQKDEVEYVLNDCTPKLVFAGNEFQETVVAVTKNVSSIRKSFAIGSKEPKEGFIPFANLYSEEGSSQQLDISADTGFVIIHTAAVGGKPRGALLSQTNIIASNLITFDLNHFGQNEAHVCILPLFHIAGLSMVMAVMHKGGKNVILERFDPVLTLQVIDKEKITVFGSFAPILKMITEKYHEGGSYDLSSLKNIGGLEDPESIKNFLKIVPDVIFQAGFGQTEAMGVTGSPAAEMPGSAGKPTILTNVALFDDNDKEVPMGTPGEICVRSPSVFLGYWGLKEETEQTFRNGWHHTGDEGRFDEKGYLWYVGRRAAKELIKPGGENVYPAEVEKAILEHGAVAEVSVIGVPDKDWGEAIKAICVLHPGQSAEAVEIIDFVASKIARYKKPKHVVFIDALPKADDGSIDRAQIKKDHGGKY